MQSMTPAIAPENYEISPRGFNLQRELIHRKLRELNDPWIQAAATGPFKATPEPQGQAAIQPRTPQEWIAPSLKAVDARIQLESLRRPL